MHGHWCGLDRMNCVRAVQNENSPAARRALLDAAHDLNPKMAEQVASQTSNMLYQGEHKGAVSDFADDGRAIIHAYQSADVSTAVRELFHVFRRDLEGNDLNEVESWLGVKNGNWETQHEEQFAARW